MLNIPSVLTSQPLHGLVKWSFGSHISVQKGGKIAEVPPNNPKPLKVSIFTLMFNQFSISR